MHWPRQSVASIEAQCLRQGACAQPEGLSPPRRQSLPWIRLILPMKQECNNLI